MRGLGFLSLASAVVVLTLFGGVKAWDARFRGGAEGTLRVYGGVPEFRLSNQKGAEVTPADLKGKVWVADFIFTRCSGQCPQMTKQMAALQGVLNHAHFVSFSADPQFDQPSVLARYADSFGADSRRWFFLTGDKETLNRIAAAFLMNKIDEPMMHSAYFVLIDGQGRVRGYYDSNDLQRMSRLLQDAKALAG